MAKEKYQSNYHVDGFHLGWLNGGRTSIALRAPAIFPLDTKSLCGSTHFDQFVVGIRCIRAFAKEITMIVVSDNLAGIVRSFGICSPNLIDDFSIQIKLDRKIHRLQVPSDDLPPISYESAIDHAAYFRESEQIAESLILGPRECVLACSQDTYKMPIGYFGLIQTKGSLARMFVSATANDGQVEPGYSGKVTLELINHSPFSVAIRPGAAVAQMYIMRCSSEVSKPYSGRYQGATGPTLPTFD